MDACLTASNVLIQSLADHSRNLKRLWLRHCPVTDAFIPDIVRSCQRLEFVDMAFTGLTVGSLRTLVDGCENIYYVNLEGCAPSSAPIPFDPVSMFSRPLRFLNLRNSGTADHVFRYAAMRCPDLHTVILEGCTAITDDSIVKLAQCGTEIEKLDCSFCPQITDLSMRALAMHSRALKVLVMSGCDLISPDGVQAIARGCPTLEEVVLHGCQRILNTFVREYSTKQYELDCAIRGPAVKWLAGHQRPLSPPTSPPTFAAPAPSGAVSVSTCSVMTQTDEPATPATTKEETALNSSSSPSPQQEDSTTPANKPNIDPNNATDILLKFAEAIATGKWLPGNFMQPPTNNGDGNNPMNAGGPMAGMPPAMAMGMMGPWGPWQQGYGYGMMGMPGPSGGNGWGPPPPANHRNRTRTHRTSSLSNSSSLRDSWSSSGDPITPVNGSTASTTSNGSSKADSAVDLRRMSITSDTESVTSVTSVASSVSRLPMLRSSTKKSTTTTGTAKTGLAQSTPPGSPVLGPSGVATSGKRVVGGTSTSGLKAPTPTTVSRLPGANTKRVSRLPGPRSTGLPAPSAVSRGATSRLLAGKIGTGSTTTTTASSPSSNLQPLKLGSPSTDRATTTSRTSTLSTPKRATGSRILSSNSSSAISGQFPNMSPSLSSALAATAPVVAAAHSLELNNNKKDTPNTKPSAASSTPSTPIKYKPRQFKKYNDDFLGIGSSPRRFSASTTPVSSPPSTPTTSRVSMVSV
ncbi:hypothetical protein HK102_003374 [Quaeritorhiza haematococci]|nr:hypothetical protein HK102_003374 [Quaeritorhiza haematococci]